MNDEFDRRHILVWTISYGFVFGLRVALIDTVLPHFHFERFLAGWAVSASKLLEVLGVEPDAVAFSESVTVAALDDGWPEFAMR